MGGQKGGEENTENNKVIETEKKRERPRRLGRKSKAVQADIEEVAKRIQRWRWFRRGEKEL